MSNIAQPHDFEPTREAALKRLDQFAPSMGQTYAAKRNTDFGQEDRSNVSLLSPYIRRRLITETEVLAKALEHHSFHSAEKYIQEVFWRSYFKGFLEARPTIWRDYQAAISHLFERLDSDAFLANNYSRAVAGGTGIDCFDAWVNELTTTGYLHNHARMWFASIWIFTLKLPWQLGANFTYRHFIDGDPASNTLSWRWVAGLHTIGKSYLARAANIREYSNGRFDPKGLSLDAAALSEGTAYPVKPVPNSLVQAPSGPAFFLLSEEDLFSESLDLEDVDVCAVIRAPVAEESSPFPTSAKALHFLERAVTDAEQRARLHFRAKTEKLEILSTESLLHLATVYGVKRILTPYAPVGPVKDALAKITPLLATEGLEVITIRRREDQLILPHATKGFFALKERIPDLLRELGLAA